MVISKFFCDENALILFDGSFFEFGLWRELKNFLLEILGSEPEFLNKEQILEIELAMILDQYPWGRNFSSYSHKLNKDKFSFSGTGFADVYKLQKGYTIYAPQSWR